MGTRPSAAGGVPTEAPTARRLAEARRHGQVAVSGDLSAALGFGALVLVLAAAGPAGLARLLAMLRASLASVGAERAGPPALAAAGQAALDAAVAVTALPLGAALLVAVAAGLAQTGGLVAWEAALRMDPGRVSFFSGLARVWDSRTLADAAWSLMKVAVLAAVAVLCVGPLLPLLPRLAGAAPGAVLAALGGLAARLGIAAALALAALGIADVLLVRRRHRRSLMMTREEVRRERRETEGDPRHRAERQRLYRERSATAASAVRAADVVVVASAVAGSGEVAVALHYERRADGAPVVVATGERRAARHLEELARQAGVPVHADAPLARALAGVSEGREIPPATYDAVAEVLAALWARIGVRNEE
jgi:flagellar biosynthesis protein FlhB